MSGPKLIAVYAGYGDTLLLQLPTSSATDKPHFWLIDGGPVAPPIFTPRTGKTRKRQAPAPPSWAEGGNRYSSYYQFLQQTLLRFCCSGTQDNKLGFRMIDLLDGIVVTHPHQDHMDGIIQLLTDWLPNVSDSPTKEKPLQFKGPVVLNDLFGSDKDVPEGYLRYMLESKGFERRPWDNVPAVPGLIQGTPPGHQLYKMIAKSNTRLARYAINLDTSSENISSIITSYRPPTDNDWPIVTTGDTTGEHVLAQLGYISTDPVRPQQPVNTLSIFKVPHHGSQRNSHVASKLSITDRLVEKPEYFFLALSAWYLGNGEFARAENRPLDPDLAQFRERVQAARVWDWVAYSDEDIPAFREAMDAASRFLCQYLNAHRFIYPDQQNPLVLDGANWVDWTTFTKLLLARLKRIEQSIRDGHPNPTNVLRYVSQIVMQDNRNQRFSLDDLKRQVRADGNDANVQGVRASLVTDMMDALSYDPFTTLQLVPGILKFYKSFDARNYVISGTRKPHGHPNPTVIAAIMAAAFDRSDSVVRRLFVTDAWGLNIEEIIYHLGFLAPNVIKNQWRSKIRVFYLDEDYIAAVPIDTTTDVPGCTEFRLDEATDSSEVRYELHNQFSRADAYNTPFSTWLARSNFSVSVLNPVNPAVAFGWLTIVNNPSIRFDLVVAQPPNVPRVNLHRMIGSAPKGALNWSIYSMSLVGRSPLLVFDDIAFLPGKPHWTSTETRWYQLVDGQMVLCHTDNGGIKTLSFQPLTPPPQNIARLHFETSSIEPPPTRTLARHKRSTVFSSAQKRSENITFAASSGATEEGFLSWWTRVAPKPLTSPVTLLDVSKVVLGDIPATVLFTTVDNQLTALTGPGVGTYDVDVDASPPVVHETDGAILVKPSLKLPSVVRLPDPNGGALVAVSSMLGEISSADSSLALHARLSTKTATECTFSFMQNLSLYLYLQAVGFQGDPNQVSIAGIAGSIAGFEFVLGFFSLIPSSILLVIEFPTWYVNPVNSEISFELGPIGADVQEAKLVPVIPDALKTIKIGGLEFSVKDVYLSLVQTDPWSGRPYNIVLCMDLSLGVGQSGLSLSLAVTQDATGQVTLNFAGTPSSVSLGSIFSGLGFVAPITIPLPFGGPDVMSGLPDLVGFTLSVPCSGAGVISLQSIFVRLSKIGWRPWEEVLPKNLWPKDTTVTVTGIITQPRSTATLAVGLQLDFSIPLTGTTANLLLGVSYWPIKPNNSDPTQRARLSMRIDPESILPAPTINDILGVFGGLSWSDVTAAIPLLQQLTTAISVTCVPVELERAPKGGPTIASFSISAPISGLKLLPKLIVESATLDITYISSSWHARIETTLLFADRYRCHALLILPTKDDAGKFEFSNLDDTFTFGAFVKEIDSTIDIATIPVIGPETLASISLSFFSITAIFVDNALSVTSFAVQINWDTSSIQQLKVSNNRLTINWSRRPFCNTPSIIGQPDLGGGGKENSWRVDWEGLLFDNWILSAGLQYSRITQKSQPSKSELVLAGSILNLAIEDVSASDLTNSLTGDSTGPSSLWQASVPPDSYFSLRQLAINCVLGEEQVCGIGAEASWGRGGSGSAVLVVRNIKPVNPKDSHRAFMLAVAVNNFRFGDLTADADLAQIIDNNLTITDASVLAFYEPIAKTLDEIKAVLDNVKAIHLLPSATSIIPLEGFPVDSSLKATMGLSIFASLSFQPRQVDSAMGSLNVVTNSTLPSTTVHIFGYFSKQDQSNRTITFTASIGSLQILPSVLHDKIAVAYVVSVSNAEKSSHFNLSGTCRIGFMSQDSWVLKGELDVQSANTITAKFSFGATGTFMLSELIKLQVSNIKFSGQYDFRGKEDTNINSGSVSHGGRSAIYHISLSAEVSFGEHTQATVALVFMSGVPGVLTIIAGSLNLGSLVQSIFSEGFPRDLLDISFEKLFMYYAWKPDYITKPVSDGTGSRDGKYLFGYHAECEAGIYGVRFLLSLDILGGDENHSGIKATATKATPVEVICVTLHGVKDSKATGPSLGFSTIKFGDGRGFFIAAGITLFGTTIGDIKLSYDFSPARPASPGFRGKLRISDVDIKFLPNVEVEFELVEEGGKNRLCFVKLPTVFQDFMDMATFIKTIKELTAKDKCGALDLIFDEIVKSSINADVKLVDSQQGQDPAEGTSGVRGIALTVTGKYTLSIGDTEILVIFEPLTFTVNNMPKSLQSFGESLLDFIRDNIPILIQGFLDNTGAFAQALALIALKKLTLETIKSLICRKKYTPEPGQGNEPGPDQKPDEGMNTDKAGPDGDAGFGDSGGAGTPGGAGGGSAVAAAAAGIVTGLPEFLLGLFGGIPSPIISPPHFPPSPPNPGTPPKAPFNDPYAQIIEDATSKDFERWMSRTEYSTALGDALNGALEYRAAIMLLRQVLQDSYVTPKLGKSFFDDYTKRREYLVYNFSTLSTRFSEKWLDMSETTVTTNVSTNPSGTRQLQLTWNPLRKVDTMVTALTLYLDGKLQPDTSKKAVDSNVMTFSLPPLSLKGLSVQLRVNAFSAIKGGRPQYQTEYAFFSQGQPAAGDFIEPAAAVEIRDANIQPKPPQGLVYSHLINPGTTVSDNTRYPVFSVANYIYWALSYDDGRTELALFAYDQNKKLVRRWDLKGARYLVSITYTPGNPDIKFLGQYNNTITLPVERLLSLPFVAMGDATKQPTPPSGLMYRNVTMRGNAGDLTKYPVLVLGPFTYWPVSDPNNTSGALLIFNAKNELVKRQDNSELRSIYQVDLNNENAMAFRCMEGRMKATVIFLYDQLEGMVSSV